MSDEDLRRAMAQAIQVAAVRAGMNQAMVAEAAGILRGTFGRYWNGKRAIPTDVFWRIAEAVGTTPDALMREARTVELVGITGGR